MNTDPTTPTATTPTATTPTATTRARLKAQYRNLDRVIGWIENADSKALILLTFDGVMVGVVSVNFGTIRSALLVPSGAAWAWLLWACVAILFVSFVFSVIFLLNAVFPRIVPGTRYAPSVFYFGDIANMSKDEFRTKSILLAEDTIEDDLIMEVHINSRIALSKLKNIRRSITLLMVVLITASTITALLLVYRILPFVTTYWPLGR